MLLALVTQCRRMRYPKDVHFIPFCSDTTVKCYKDAGVTYRGTWSMTESGAECLNWNSNGLMDRKYSSRREDAAELGLGNHNYCR